jgi:serine/threonine-protein kinase
VVAGVPDVVGLPSGVAEATLASLGLHAAISGRASDVQPGIVLAQVPSAGSPASPGMTVELTVAVPRPVAVPDVVGLPLGDAKAALEQVGLVLAVIGSELDDDVAEGSVLRIDPPPGTELERGSTVSAVLSLGRPVAVPSLVGLDVDTATRRCEDLRLTLRIRSEEPVSGTAAGTVLRQDPGAGAQVRPGSVVQVVVARSVEPAVVPDVRNRPLAEAVKILRLRLLTAENAGGQLSLTVPAGNVLSQDPLPGQRVPPGTTVRLVVAVAASQVPAVTGKQLAVASGLLADVGLDVDTRFRSGGIEDRVIAQEPGAGTIVARGSTVVLTVSVGRFNPHIPGGGGRPVLPRPIRPEP